MNSTELRAMADRVALNSSLLNSAAMSIIVVDSDYTNILRSLCELADIKDAAGKGVTDEIVDIAMRIYKNHPGFYRGSAMRAALEAIAPMLTQSAKPSVPVSKLRELADIWLKLTIFVPGSRAQMIRGCVSDLQSLIESAEKANGRST